MINQIAGLVNQELDRIIKKPKNYQERNLNTIRKRIFNSLIDFCIKKNLDPLSLSCNDFVTFCSIDSFAWDQNVVYTTIYDIHYIYNNLLTKKFKLIKNRIVLEELKKAFSLLYKRRETLKEENYLPIIGEKEAKVFYSELQNPISKIIFLLYKFGLQKKEIINLKIGQISKPLMCLVVKKRLYGVTKYKERLANYRLLRFDKTLLEMIEQYLLSRKYDWNDESISNVKLFQLELTNTLFKELDSVANKFGFSTGAKFLKELRKLIIVRLHRKSAPIGVIMDYMNISRYGSYYSEIRNSKLNRVDEYVINRSLEEAFNL